MFSTNQFKVATADGHNVTVLEAFTYTTKAGEVLTVPAGAQSDGLSIPKEFWNLAPPFGQYWPAGVLHDYLYRGTARSKDFCDSIFLEAMESLGVDLVLRTMIYEGVHLGGWHAFRDDRAPTAAPAASPTATPVLVSLTAPGPLPGDAPTVYCEPLLMSPRAASEQI